MMEEHSLKFNFGGLMLLILVAFLATAVGRFWGESRDLSRVYTNRVNNINNQLIVANRNYLIATNFINQLAREDSTNQVKQKAIKLGLIK
ncbi:MAG: hypothetical protein ACXABY_21260 [Candidatus Thorarchaeota archaeon]|jgi:hypothetical protein